MHVGRATTTVLVFAASFGNAAPDTAPVVPTSGRFARRQQYARADPTPLKSRCHRCRSLLVSMNANERHQPRFGGHRAGLSIGVLRQEERLWGDKRTGLKAGHGASVDGADGCPSRAQREFGWSRDSNTPTPSLRRTAPYRFRERSLAARTCDGESGQRCPSVTGCLQVHRGIAKAAGAGLDAGGRLGSPDDLQPLIRHRGSVAGGAAARTGICHVEHTMSFRDASIVGLPGRRRRERGSTLITTNQLATQWGTVSGDEVL